MKDKLRQLKKEIEATVEHVIDTPSRKRPLTYARAVFCKVGREQLGLTFEEIGNALNRDHATVMHSINVVFPFAMQESRFQTLYYILKDKYKVKKKHPAERTNNIALTAVEMVESLKAENAKLKDTIRKTEYANNKFTDLLDGLNQDELDEIYNKLDIFVKLAIKNRVYR